MKKPMKRFPLALFVFLLGLAAIVASALLSSEVVDFIAKLMR